MQFEEPTKVRRYTRVILSYKRPEILKKEEIAGARRNIVVVSADIEPTGKREALALT